MPRLAASLMTILATMTTAAALAAPPSPPASTPPVPDAAPQNAADHAAIARILRGLLLQNLPNPVIESAHNWGHRKDVTVGWKIERDGPLRWHTTPQTVTRNDGHWQKVHVQALEPAKSLEVSISNVRVPEAGKTQFDAVVKLRVRLTYEQQMWKVGARLYAGETRAVCDSELRLVVEITDRIEFQPGALLPNLLFRVRVAHADLTYSNLVCEHTLGLDGGAAKLLGQAVHEFIKKVKPNLETELLARANGAIVRAADTKEVKVELGKLLSGNKRK